MKKSEFTKMFKGMLKDSRDGYFGYGEIMDECWYYLENEQMRNKDLWKEVKRLRKKYEPELPPRKVLDEK